jgi:phosphoglycolate phosphatase
MRAVIFDLDGTLCDSAPDLQASANVLLADLGKAPLPLDAVRGFIGNGVPKLVGRVMRASDIGFSPERHADLTRQFEKIYAANPVAGTVLYPGVRQVLDKLRSEGSALGVCTNKVHHITMQVLRGLDIDGYFGSVIGGDSLPTHKPDPAMMHACIGELGGGDVVYVGDSEVDAATALAARIPFALFSEGYRKSPVEDIPHDALFSDFSELPDILNKM